MIQPILLCCDLDRTLLPNGEQEESPYARHLFSELVKRPELNLAYVSGRDLKLIQAAITDYQLPVPDYAVGDVGSTVYRVNNGQWDVMVEWESDIARDWNGHGHQALERWCSDVPGLTLQESSRQNNYKLSYYTAPEIQRQQLVADIETRLQHHGVQASVIWSFDEAAQVGLLDILPLRATKLHAVQYLMKITKLQESRLLFAGDSGNDVPVLGSGLQATLVANALAEVRVEAEALLRRSGQLEKLYIAQGNLFGMNGNYAAGVLEGLVHFFPETKAWMEQTMSQLVAKT